MDDENEVIYFNSKSLDYGWLSNFYLHQIFIKNKAWPSVEHFFQAQKFLDEVYVEKIRNTPLAVTAKKMGRSRAYKIKQGWDCLRCEVMKEALQAKFEDDPHMRMRLLETNPIPLVEDSQRDYFWGCGKNKTGKNILGRLLMELRDKILLSGNT